MANIFTDKLDELRDGKPVYICVVLDEPSQATLKEWATGHFGKLHPQVKCHHMTVVFKPAPEVVAQLAGKLGKNIPLEVSGVGGDNCVQAVKVAHPLPKELANRVPHITLAVADGAKPAQSNDLVFEDIGEVGKELSLNGTLMAFGNTPKVAQAS